MISLDTQKQLANVIMTIAHEEKALEVIRQVLGEQALFTPYTAFLRLDRKKKGFLDKAALKRFLQYCCSLLTPVIATTASNQSRPRSAPTSSTSTRKSTREG